MAARSKNQISDRYSLSINSGRLSGERSAYRTSDSDTVTREDRGDREQQLEREQQRTRDEEQWRAGQQAARSALGEGEAILDRIAYRAPSSPADDRATAPTSRPPANTERLTSRVSSHPPQYQTPPPPQVNQRRDTMRDTVHESSGYYSRTDAQVESLEIPKPPRLPRIDDFGGAADAVGDSEPFPENERLAGLRHRAPTWSGLDRQSSPPSTEASARGNSAVAEDSPADTGVRRKRTSALPGSLAPRIFVPPGLRRQAMAWLSTGSLDLPLSSSPRHARAKQRALLAALLMEPGWDGLPMGMQQRAAWLFRSEWAAGEGARDADDLCTMLGFDATTESRNNLVQALAGAIPLGASPPPSSRRPDSLRASLRPTVVPRSSRRS